MYGRELAGDVLPHIVIARTWDEVVDTSVIQLTNTLLPFGLGYGLSRFYDGIQKQIQPLETKLAKQWFYLGKSLALFGFLAAIPVANAFIRNWVTAKRTGTDGFIEVVGEKSVGFQSEAEQQKLKQKIKSQEHHIVGIWSAGAMTSLAIFGLTQLAIKRKLPFGKIPSVLSKYIGLSKGKFENFPKPDKSLFGKIALPPILFWGLPIYAGLFSASRDQFEFKELVLRFATFLTSFFILPRLAKDVMVKRAPEFLKKKLGSAENAGVLTEFVATSILFAVLPPLVNIYLTHQRVKKEGEKEWAKWVEGGYVPIQRRPLFVPVTGVVESP